jgi:hypothetical protein
MLIVILLPVCVVHSCGTGAVTALAIIPIVTACPFFLFFRTQVWTNRIQPGDPISAIRLLHFVHLVDDHHICLIVLLAQISVAAAPIASGALTSLELELAALRAANDALEVTARSLDYQ